MLTTLSKLFKYIIILALILGLGSVAFFFLMNPNTSKEGLENKLEQYTGQKFVINGAIDYKFGKITQLIVKDISSAGNADGSAPVINVKQATIRYNLLSLLKNDLLVESVDLSDVTINFGASGAAGNTSAITASNNEMTGKHALIKKLTMSNVAMQVSSGSTVNWEIRNGSITADNVDLFKGGKPNPMQLRGDLVNGFTGVAYKIDTTVNIDLVAHTLKFDPLKLVWLGATLQGSSTISHLNTTPALAGNLMMSATSLGDLLKQLDPYMTNADVVVKNNIQFEMTYNYTSQDCVLDVSKLSLKVDEGVIDGNIKIKHIPPLQAEFNLDAKNLSLQPIFMLIDAMFPPLPSSDFLPFDLMRNMAVNGKFTGNNLMVTQKLQLDSANIQLVGQDGIYQLSPVTLSAQGNVHNINMQLDLNSKTLPFFQFTDQADRVDLEEWLGALNFPTIIDGNASLKVNIEGMGKDWQSIKQSLNGDINLQVSNGTLQGFDIEKLVSFANNTITQIFDEVAANPKENLNSLIGTNSNNWIETQKGSPSTQFTNMEIKANIQNGIGKKTSIDLTNAVCDLKGTGTFDLPNNTLEYEAFITQTGVIKTDIPALIPYIQQTPIPLLIAGTLDKPTFGPNIQSFATQVINVAQTDILNQAVSKMVAATPPSTKTSKTASEIFVDSLNGLTQ